MFVFFNTLTFQLFLPPLVALNSLSITIVTEIIFLRFLAFSSFFVIIFQLFKRYLHIFIQDRSYSTHFFNFFFQIVVLNCFKIKNPFWVDFSFEFELTTLFVISRKDH